MLHPQKLHTLFSLLASLPTDAVNSVTALYEALVYISDELTADVTWKFHSLLTGFLLPNVLGRTYHTYAVWLILQNYRRLILHRAGPVQHQPIVE